MGANGNDTSGGGATVIGATSRLVGSNNSNSEGEEGGGSTRSLSIGCVDGSATVYVAGVVGITRVPAVQHDATWRARRTPKLPIARWPQ